MITIRLTSKLFIMQYKIFFFNLWFCILPDSRVVRATSWATKDTLTQTVAPHHLSPPLTAQLWWDEEMARTCPARTAAHCNFLFKGQLPVYLELRLLDGSHDCHPALPEHLHTSLPSDHYLLLPESTGDEPTLRQK